MAFELRGLHKIAYRAVSCFALLSRHHSGDKICEDPMTRGSCDTYGLKVKVNFSLEQATKAQRGSICIALLFL